MAKQQSYDEVHADMVKLLASYDEVADHDDLLHRQQLAAVIAVLRNNLRLLSNSKLPKDKKADLAGLLPRIHHALQQCKAKPPPPPPPKKKTPLPSVSDCNPFKSKSTSQSQSQQEGGAPSTTLSLESLRQQAKAIFADAAAEAGAGEEEPKPEEVVEYEWTTSYVDDTRIFGWDEEAAEVVDALVGPEGDDEKKEEEVSPFRAAAIVGIHGSGKTALAQKVFVHDRIKDAFPLRLWVCVGPPDHEDRLGLLYRMLDNLGLDTAKVETIVHDSNAVKNSADKDKSKIGVLLFILHVTLYKTGYLIVFDDIRSHDLGDGWYSNLALPPPMEREWGDRLAYGLPKPKSPARKSAVLITCRREDDARAMVRTGAVFRPPDLTVEQGWKLFEREYRDARKKEEDDKLYDDLLVKMQKEIVDKCLGLPVAIIQAAKGFANYDDAPPPPKPTQAAADDDDEAHHSAS